MMHHESNNTVSVQGAIPQTLIVDGPYAFNAIAKPISALIT